MNALLDLEGFERFLRKGAARVEMYSESTVQTILRETKTAINVYTRGAPFAVRPAVKQAFGRIIAFAEEAPTAVAGPFVLACKVYLAEKRNVRIKRKSAPRSIDDATWRRMSVEIERDERREARVLEVMQATGLRIGDVLRIGREELEAGLTTGHMEIQYKGADKRVYATAGAREPWQRLRAAWLAEAPDAKNVAAWISPGSAGAWLPGQAAYTRVRQHLRIVCARLQITERVFLHRLRRTVAIAGLRASGKDVVAVGKLLGHQSIAATQRYLDEFDADEVSDLQEKIKRGFKKEPKK